MAKKLIKTTELSKQELRNVKNLWSICHQQDHFPIKLYWNIIINRQLSEFDDFLYYQDNRLIAYLALFVFKEDEAELNAMVHPQSRHHGIFRQLLDEAAIELKRRRIANVLLICNQKNPDFIHHIKQVYGATFDHTECQMHHVRKPSPISVPAVELVKATEKDIPTMARIDNQCFSSSYDRVVFRFIQNMEEKCRTAWVVKAAGNIVGKVHVRIDDNDKVFIHDLGILPEYRRQRFATSIVLTLLELLKKKNYKTIYLDVLADNDSAITLYEKCGFELTAHHDFYRIPVKALIV